MKSPFSFLLKILLSGIIIFSVSSCEELEEIQEELQKAPTPTKNLMQGVWEVTEAYDLEKDTIITDYIKVLFNGFHLSSDNTVVSTAGPMTTYLVYGPNKYSNVTSMISQVFNYAELNWTGGEFFIGSKVQERFTLEMKLEGVGGSNTLNDMLGLIGIEVDCLSEVVYHRFLDVKVDIDESQPDQMVWTFDDATTTFYFLKDDYGDTKAWAGWDIPFRKCRFVLEKRSKSLIDIVTEINESK